MVDNRTLQKNLNFNYDLNHKVYGLVEEDEAHEMYYEGFITKLFEPEFSKTVGLFELVIYDLEKAKEFNQFDSIMEMLNDLSNETESRFTNLSKLADDFELEFKDKDRVIFLKNCIIHPEWRGKGILEELMKSIYQTHFTSNSMLIVNSSPIQNIREELDLHMVDFVTEINDGKGNKVETTTGKYFQLYDLPASDEAYEYKLYAKMLKLNLKQFEGTNFFYQDNKNELLKLFKIEKKSLNL